MSTIIIEKYRYYIFIVFILFLLTISPQAHEFVEHDFEEGVNYVARSYKPGEDSDGLFTRAKEPSSNKTRNQNSLKYEDRLLSTKYEKILKPGKDGRIRINKPAEWPHSVHTQLAIFFENKEYGGSGVMVGPRHVLTCGHNVFDTEKNSWAQSIKVHPSLNDKHCPFGVIKVLKTYTFRAWIQNGAPEYDLALLVLQNPIGLDTGWAGIHSYSDEDLKLLKVSITGYPSDKGFNQLWTMEHKLKLINPENFSYEIDTFGGQSGSPIWASIKGDPYIVGVHTRGGKDENFGVRISFNKFKNYLSCWIEKTYEITPTLAMSPVQSFYLPRHIGHTSLSYSSPNSLFQGVGSAYTQQHHYNSLPLAYSSSAQTTSLKHARSWEDDSSNKPNDEEFHSDNEKNLTNLMLEVGFSRSGTKDETKLARHFLEKVCKVKSKNSIAKALEITHKTLSNFIEGRDSPTIINKLMHFLTKKECNFYIMAQEALQSQQPKKRKQDDSTNE